jgi:hypothetical protein
MDKQQDTDLLKARSYRRVLTVGFRTFTEHFRAFFKASWQMALLYSITCGALGTLTAIRIPELTTAIMQQVTAYQGVYIEPLLQYSSSILVLLLLLLLSVTTLSLGSATILAKLKEHKDTGCISTPPSWLTASPRLMGRTLKGVFATLMVALLPFLLVLALIVVIVKTQPDMLHGRLITALTTAFIMCIVTAALALPLMHVLMKYIMEPPCSFWKTLRKHYSSGMRHWGMLFLVFFVSTLTVQLVQLVVMLPAHILNIASQTAYLGLLKGDPLGMPSYINTLTFVTFTLCCFIAFYVSQVMLVHNYYAYGAIEAKEQERKELEINI